MLNSSIWHIDRTLSGATTQSQSRPESNGHEGVLNILQSSTTWASPSDSLVSYPGHLLGRDISFYEEMQSAYSTVATKCTVCMYVVIY